IMGTADAEPLSTRAARMKTYNALIRELDSDGSNYSKDLSEVDLADPDDVKVTVADPAGAVLLHLGATNYLERYKTYIAHAAEWRGTRKGVIVDLDKAVSAIQRAVEQAETVAEASVGSAVVGVAGPHVRGVNSRGGIALGSRSREISREDVRAAVERARAIS